MAIPGLVEIGTSVWGTAILNQGMITRTPNGDLYASCGDMGQNLDLSISAGHPIRIWYSNDDGATWVVSKTIYVDDMYFGGGGNGVCIASDSAGLVHVAFAARRQGVTARSINIVYYYHGKHGYWGGRYIIFQIEHETILDCLPKVVGLEVNSSDLAHILFSLRGSGETDWLYHVWDPGSGQFSWEVISGEAHSTLGGRNRFAIDGNDTVCVVYGNAVQEKYYYKQKAVAGGWGSSVWIGMGDWYGDPAIAIDKDNTRHIAIDEGSEGYYRQLSSAGVWGSIEQFSSLNLQASSISISQDSVVHIARHKTSGNFYIRTRVDGVWSSEENWTDGTTGWGVCMLHSYWPKIGTQHINILKTGWAFHWRPSHYASYYKADFTKDAYVTTDPATLITAIAATLNGTLVYDGEENCTCGFDYGLTDSYGSQIEALESYYNTGESFAKLITGLLPATTYHFRARATNSAGTFYGADLTFTTIGGVYPSEVTTRVSALIHRWVPGSYTLEVVLGGLTSEYGLRVPSGKPSPTIPDIPSCPPGYVLSWSLDRGYFCIPEADIPPVYPETMEEYY